MSAEREVLARVRGASRKTSTAAIAEELAALPTPRTAPVPGPDLCVALVGNLQRSGATTATVADRGAAIAELARYIASRHSQRRVVAGHDPRLAALPWRDGGLLPRFGCAEPGDAVGVSYARYAVAESGSLCLWVDRDNPALNNLLCEDHVVLVDTHTIRRSFEEIWQEQAWSDARTRPRGLMLISGPSSTADIAMQLVMGAHGPRALHVIVLGADAGPAAEAPRRSDQSGV